MTIMGRLSLRIITAPYSLELLGLRPYLARTTVCTPPHPDRAGPHLRSGRPPSASAEGRETPAYATQ